MSTVSIESLRVNSRSTSAAAHVAQAVLLLRRRAQQQVSKELARRLTNLAAGLQCLIEPVEAIERALDTPALRNKHVT